MPDILELFTHKKLKGLEFGSIPLEIIKDFATLQIKNLIGIE